MARAGLNARTYTVRALRSLIAPSTAPLWIVAIVLMSVAISFTALGGFGRAVRTPTPAVAGDEVRTSLYAVTVLGAELTDEVEDQFLSAEPGEDLLVVTLVLENLTSTPAGVISSVDNVSSRFVEGDAAMLAIAGLDAVDDISVWRDGSSASVILQPRVPAEVRIAWLVPEGSFPDGEAFLEVYDARIQRGQVILSRSAVTWNRTQQAARISMRVAP